MNNDQRINLARKSLKGVSIGDAFGESFFGETNIIEKCIREKRMPQTSWEFTDDTVMSIAVYEQLEKHGTINQDDLARQFSIKHKLDPNKWCCELLLAMNIIHVVSISVSFQFFLNSFSLLYFFFPLDFL